VQIAAPSLVATLVADMALGFLGKASPQLPVLFIGLAVKNLVGLTVLMAAMAYWPRMFSQQFAKAIRVGEGAAASGAVKPGGLRSGRQASGSGFARRGRKFFAIAIARS
jgi:hypothetical protein